MPKAAIAGDILEPVDIHLDHALERALDRKLVLNRRAKPLELFFCQVLRTHEFIDHDFLQNAF